jgi:leucyl aminopeptidase
VALGVIQAPFFFVQIIYSAFGCAMLKFLATSILIFIRGILRMATIKVSTNSIFVTQADSIVIPVEQDFTLQATELKALQELIPAFEDAKTKYAFTGKAMTTLALVGSRKGKVVDVVLVGLGTRDTRKQIPLERYRKALGNAVRVLETRKSSSLALQLPDAKMFGITEQELAKQTVIALEMAMYHFDQFITDNDRKIKDLKAVELVCDSAASKQVQDGIAQGEIIAQGVNQCRRWVDLPAESLHPEILANHAQDIRFNEKEVCQMGMGGLCGVSKGSDRDCQFVVMEYNCGVKDAPTLCFVGKGITFDSGGLSIKPAVNMETMKEDMSGAAAVVNAMEVIANMKPKHVNVVGITPLSENLPSGKATKPGDILTFYNGKTAEVKNTDAEGRLILADALSYAVKHYKLDAIIDLATLTGACAYALGPHFSGMMSQHDELVDKVEKAAVASGDAVWRLPLPDEYNAAIKSPIADICNIGSQRYMAGAVTAALFLKNFVDEVPWVHLDIAGTAHDVPDISYLRADSATGVGVRLIVEIVMNWK